MPKNLIPINEKTDGEALCLKELKACHPQSEAAKIILDAAACYMDRATSLHNACEAVAV